MPGTAPHKIACWKYLKLSQIYIFLVFLLYLFFLAITAAITSASVLYLRLELIFLFYNWKPFFSPEKENHFSFILVYSD